GEGSPEPFVLPHYKRWRTGSCSQGFLAAALFRRVVGSQERLDTAPKAFASGRGGYKKSDRLDAPSHVTSCPPSYGPAGVIFCDVNFACAMSHSAFTKNLHGCFDIPLGSLVALVLILTSRFPSTVRALPSSCLNF